MIRSAPPDGYDTGRKRHYRRQVWKTLREACQVPVSQARGLLMPSSEGDEIDVALSNGFRENNLFIVDRNPAIVAVLKRRYPRINTVGLTLSRVPERVSAGSIDVASLDMCGNACNIEKEIEAFAQVLTNFACVCVTMLRGRETNFPNTVAAIASGHRALQVREDASFKGRHVQDDYGSISPQDTARVAIVEAAISGIKKEVVEWKRSGVKPVLQKGNFPIRIFNYASSSKKSTLLVAFYQTMIFNAQAPLAEQLKLKNAMKTVRTLRERYIVSGGL